MKKDFNLDYMRNVSSLTKYFKCYDPDGVSPKGTVLDVILLGKDF